TGVPVVDTDGVVTSGSGLLPADTDGDGISDQLDLDSDGDGLFDLEEAGGTDTDNNGLVDGFTDTNGDGFDDGVTTSALPLPDADGNGIADYLENTDSDNDGIPDSIDLDDDNDGIPDALEGNGLVDSDGDGIVDSLDLDSDNDGLFDLLESGADSGTLDTNNDGQIDPANGVGSNGLADMVETVADSGAVSYNGGLPLDTDGDGVEDFRDLDSDNDGIPDVIEAGGSDDDGDGIVGTGVPTVDTDGVVTSGGGLLPADTDGDGISDQLDLDSDGDGLFDLEEAGGTDTNNNGLVDDFTDTNGDGFDDGIAGSTLPLPDTDGDGIVDQLDLDSDNDGIMDVIESGGTDPDGDGLLGPAPQIVDDNGVEIGGALTSLDTDGDGVLNQHDLDSDNDGIPDVTEAGGNDPDADGIIGTGLPTVDALGLVDGIILNPADTDGDTELDLFDVDSDGDGINDLVEAGGLDVDDNGQIDGFVDTDGNGFDNQLALTTTALPDDDNDGIPDYQDTNDADNDGIPDNTDLDDDNDGIPDSLEGDGLVDTDGDGIVDSLDLDSDNDGLFDLIESGITNPAELDTDNDGRIDNSFDVGVNGLSDSVEVTLDDGIINYNGGVVIDTDNDGIVDFRDLDSDNDSISDVVESGGSDDDGDGTIGSGVPVTNINGLASGSGLLPIDTDADGTADHRDLDADNDGLLDIVETGRTDSDGDGIVDSFEDLNGDGLDDAVSDDSTDLMDTDYDGLPDYQDITDDRGEIRTGLKGVGQFNLWILLVLAMLKLVTRLKPKKALMIFLLFFSVTGTANAQVTDQQEEEFEEVFYIGAGVGYSLMRPGTDETIYSIDDDTDSGTRLYLGMDVNQYFSLELSMSNLGTATLKPVGEIDYQILSLNALYYFYDQNGNDHVGLASYIKAGIGNIDNSATVPYSITNSVQISLGLGVEYAWENGFAVRADLESYDEDASLWTIGLLYRFGKQDAAPVPVKVVAPAPKDGDMDGVFDAEDECPQTPTGSMVDLTGCELDSDNDGVVDSQDQCPSSAPAAKVDQLGCDLDTDGDGVIDIVDQCPDTAAARTVDSSGCELDSDIDGVVDSKDQCPATVAGVQVDDLGCNVDLDADGVLNTQDECPATIRGANVNAVGCAIFETKIEGVNFKVASAELTKKSRVILDKAIVALLEFPSVRIQVQAHTDSQGTIENNQKLSDARAQSVVEYLVSKGVTGSRLEAKGFGESTPLVSNALPEGRAQNRRVQFHVLSNGLTDEVIDVKDPCSTTEAGTKVNQLECEASNDNDADGILNLHDECPASISGAKVNSVGCAILEIKTEGVKFKLASVELTKKSKLILNKAITELLKFPLLRIQVQAHTDSQGTIENNQKLSAVRAQSVVDYLVSKGVNSSRLEARGFGESMPLVSNKLPAGRAQNRRVEFHILPSEAN
ncbi:MAG: OmpA family protein, partial [Gammaproteobacteria bacterium]|nr:OmpA family protein [Gammaproteobacteria bacterium]